MGGIISLIHFFFWLDVSSGCVSEWPFVSPLSFFYSSSSFICPSLSLCHSQLCLLIPEYSVHSELSFPHLDLGFPACSLTLQLLCPLYSCSLITEAFPPQQTLLSCGPKRWIPFALGPNYSLSSSSSSLSSPTHRFVRHTLTLTFLRRGTYH